MNFDQRVELINPARRTVLIGFNPNAGATSSESPIARLSDALKQRGLEVQLETDIERIAVESERLLASGQLRAVVAAGGDGTASLFANRLRAETPLAIYPLGTENLLAKHLCVSNNPVPLADAIGVGHTARLDAGLANGRVFLVLASCGFDAEVVHQLHGQRRGNISRLSYAWPLFRSITKYRYPNMRIRCDGGPEFSARWAFVFNAPQYALQLPIVHDASCLDGKLDLCSFRGGNLFNVIIYASGVVLRQHRKWKDTFVTKFESLVIESDEPVPYQLDGDPGGHLPLEIKVAPQRLRVVVPENWLQSHVPTSLVDCPSVKPS